jgi:hypothetical protein
VEVILIAARAKEVFNDWQNFRAFVILVEVLHFSFECRHKVQFLKPHIVELVAKQERVSSDQFLIEFGPSVREKFQEGLHVFVFIIWRDINLIS